MGGVPSYGEISGGVSPLTENRNMFENWNRFVTETQKRIKAEKPRGHPQTEKKLQNRRKAKP